MTSVKFFGLCFVWIKVAEKGFFVLKQYFYSDTLVSGWMLQQQTEVKVWQHDRMFPAPKHVLTP